MISIDPGEHCCYARWALNLEDQDLVACGPWAAVCDVTDEYAVIETQVIIPKFTKQPASIITLAHRAGAVAAAFGWPEEDRVTWVTPRAWKGSTKKPTSAAAWTTYAIHTRNVRTLNSQEMAVYIPCLLSLPEGQRHDLADAVGIGLWHLGRT